VLAVALAVPEVRALPSVPPTISVAVGAIRLCRAAAVHQNVIRSGFRPRRHTSSTMGGFPEVVDRKCECVNRDSALSGELKKCGEGEGNAVN
jgi:hypothetical protein